MTVYLRIRPNSKVPDVRKGESIDSATTDSLELVEQWTREGFNVALRLKDRTVVDFDEAESGRRFFREHPELSTYIVMSRRGPHFHFLNETRPRRFEHGDIKSGENSYVLIPPSEIDGVQYRLVRNTGLVPFPEELFPDVRRKVQGILVKDIDAYLSKIESVQGNGGSHGLVRAAARCRDFGLSEAEAMAKLIVWNQNPQLVSPEWSIDELARAVTRVYERGRK